MKSIFYTLFMLILSQSLQAQTWMIDTISMGAGYSEDVFYSFKDGAVINSASNTRWDIAFYVNASGQQSFSAAVRANHSQPSQSGFTGMQVYTLGIPSFYWDSISYMDTSFVSQAMYNDEHDYDKGAFNQNANSSNPFDFGWGKYNSSNHNLYGDSIYLIRKGQTYYKFIVDSLKGSTSTWYCRIAELSSPTTTSFVVNAGPSYPYSNKIFAYYDIETNTILDREPTIYTWDINFTKYSPEVDYQGTTIHYPLAGPLAHRNYKVAKLDMTDPTTVNNSTASALSYSDDYSLMAWKWRKPFTNDTIGNLSYFLKPTYDTTKIYQIVYTYIGGQNSGELGFMYRELDNITSLKITREYLQEVDLFPNPSTIGQVYVSVSTQRPLEDVSYVVYDMMGRVMVSGKTDMGIGEQILSISTEALSSGFYILQLADDAGMISSGTFEVQK